MPEVSGYIDTDLNASLRGDELQVDTAHTEDLEFARAIAACAR